MVTASRSAKIDKENTDGPDPIDIHVGKRLRQRRTLAGLSQEQIAKALGLTFQQVQKYERGANRIGASRLFQLGRILNVPVNWFFEDLPAAGLQPSRGFGESGQAPLDDLPGEPQVAKQTDAEMLRRRETLEFVRAYYRITDPKKRRKIYELIKSMADDSI